MDINKRKALVSAGWVVGDAADFLEMSEEERQLLDARMQRAAAIRQARASSNLSQKELGKLLSTSQLILSRVRSEMISRSNWAKDKRTFSISQRLRFV